MKKLVDLLKQARPLASGAWLGFGALWLAGKIDLETTKSACWNAVGLWLLAEIVAALLKRWEARRADKV